MTVVVQFKPKGRRPPEATRIAIETALFRLADTYGAHEVVTVATSVIAVAIEAALATDRPNNKLWVEDLKARLKNALKGTP